MGDPTGAAPEKGDQIMERAVAVGVQLIEVLDEQRRRRAESPLRP
jgi:creatinine amidohydrolase/Fe(II)-dependent formamide hydrolase-like protein